jgi:hypothetical protein
LGFIVAVRPFDSFLQQYLAISNAVEERVHNKINYDVLYSLRRGFLSS